MKSITVLIANRPYPLKINEEDEKKIREIVKEINDKINNFQLNYTQKDKQDCLAMVLLTYAVDLNKQKDTKQMKELSQKLNLIEELLESSVAI